MKLKELWAPNQIKLPFPILLLSNVYPEINQETL
jgi:hypothetical protein